MHCLSKMEHFCFWGFNNFNDCKDAEAHSPVLSPVFTRTRSASRGVTQKSSIVVRRNKVLIMIIFYWC